MGYSAVVLAVWHILIVTAIEDGGKRISCDGNIDDENYLDGYTFLEDESRVYLVMTTNKDVYKMTDGTSVTCISSVTTGKNNETHELLESVDYKNESSGTWGGFTQTYQFFGDTNRFNKMELKEKNGAPTGRYKFIYASKHCAVVEVDKFEVHILDENGEATGDNSAEETPGDAIGSGEHANKKNDEQVHCMMWAKHENNRGLQAFCEPYFKTCCKPKDPNYSYTPRECTIPEERYEL